jgi:hypothetical protein
MAAATARRRLTEEERAERVEALTAELAAAGTLLPTRLAGGPCWKCRPGSAGTF